MLHQNYREEEEDPQSKTVREERPRWSVWREAMVPQNIGAEDQELYSPRTARQGIKTHYYNNKTRQELLTQCQEAGDCSGVYELKVERNGEEAVAYIGSAHRETGRSLYDRISEYMLDGSHIRRIIQRALDRGFEVHVRWLKIREDLFPEEDVGELAEDVENEYLDEYNYPWNERENVQRREIFNIGVQI